MIIVESVLRKIVKEELKKVLFEQEAIINVELPQDEQETTITMGAEEIADIASAMADSDQESDFEQMNLAQQQIDTDTYLSERKFM